MTRIRLSRHALALASLLGALAASSPLHGQTPALPTGTPDHSAAEWVALGNTAYDARKVPEALKDYEAALGVDSTNYEALWRAARADVDLGQYDANQTRQKAFFSDATTRARRAVQVNANDAWGHFVLAEALGRTAQSLGVRDRIKYAGEVRDQALQCLKIDPKHAGCLHVMGEWNAEVMRLSGISRMIAKTFLGGQVFNQASWPEAQRYLEQAAANEPQRIVHHLDLGRVYVDRDQKELARAQFQMVIDGNLTDYNDPHYKDEARQALKSL